MIYVFKISVPIGSQPILFGKTINQHFFSQMTFTRPANHRQLTFEEIAKNAKITVNEVQFLGLGYHSSRAAT